MSTVLHELGRQNIASGDDDWDLTHALMLMDTVAFTDNAVKAVTGATNATPIVLTITAHGWANGDIIYVQGVGGNLAARGIWQIANQAANTVELKTPDGLTAGVNAVGSAAYTSGGYAINISSATQANALDDYDGCRIGADQTLTSPTAVRGVLDAADPTHPSVAGGNVAREGLIFRSTGTPSTSLVTALMIHHQIVTANTQAAASATAILVEPLIAGIPSGTVLTFSNGASATLSALASKGDRTLAVTALAAIVTAGARALAPVTGSNWNPAAGGLTTNGGNIQTTFDSAGIIKI